MFHGTLPGFCTLTACLSEDAEVSHSCCPQVTLAEVSSADDQGSVHWD